MRITWLLIQYIYYIPIITSGTLAPPMLSAKDSIDLIFSTHWVYPARIPILQPIDKECIKNQIIRTGTFRNHWKIIFANYNKLVHCILCMIYFDYRLIRSLWIWSVWYYIKMPTAFTASSTKRYPLWNSVKLWTFCCEYGANDGLPVHYSL